MGELYKRIKEQKNKKPGALYQSIEKRNLNLDTFDTDLTSASDLVHRVYGGWHSADDMSSSYKTVSDMRDRLNAHKSYMNNYESGQDLTKYNESMDSLIKAYDTALAGWDDLSAEYAKYSDADSYGVAKKSAERYNKYKGMDYAGVQKAIKENPEDAEFLSKYGLNVGYANKADAEKEISAIDYLIETTTGAEQKALKDYRNRMYEMYMSNPKAVFKGSEAFADGWQPGDILDAIGSTAIDAVVTAGKGIASSMEGVADLATYGASGLANLLGADTAAAYMKDLAKTNMTQNLFLPYESSSVNRDSVLGGFSDSVAQGVGQMGFNLLTAGMGQGLGLGKLGTNVLSRASQFVSASGRGMSEAYEGEASDKEALIYGLLTGAIETGTEMMAGGFGNGVTALGLSHGLGGVDDIIAKKIGEKIPNFILRNAAEFGIKATGEGLEEVFAGFGSALAKNLTYMSEEDYWKLVEDEDLLNQFLVGTMASMVTQSPSLMRSYKYGTDFVTDRNGFEEAYVSEEFEKRLAEAEKDGNKLSGIEKDKLYHQVEEDLKKRQEEAREQYKRKASGSVSNMATYDTTDSVDNATGDTIKLHGVRNDSGNTVLKTNLGDRTLDSVTLNRRDAELVSATEGMDDDTADLFVSMYSGGSVESYKASFDLVHAYGNAAYGVENSVARRGALTEEQAVKVYEHGVSERTSVPQKQIDAITEKHFANGEALKEGTFDDSAIHYEKLNSRQKASVAFLKMFSKATGMNVVMFESAVDENGHREAKQGYYEPSTNSIHIDVYAGMDKDLFDDAIIPVMSHEVTHWMQFKAPEAYAKMSGIIMDTMSRELGVSPEQLVAMERNRLKKSGHDADDAYAQDEIIARACEDMLSGNRKASEIIEQMDEETAKTFSEKFKEVISKIRAWLKDLLKAYKSNSEEAKIIRKYDDSLAKLQKAWDEGFEQAIRANQAIKTNGSGETKYSFSSIANSFFGNEKMSTDDFLAGGYKKTEGYRTYVEQCVNNMRQTRDISESVARAEVEKSIAGIVDVAIAAKKAGYDIYDDAEKRSKKDSKDRLLFSSLEPNSDYFTSSDISTICDKRQNFAEIYDDIIRAEEEKGVPEGKRFFNNVDNYFYIHKVLADKGLTQPCRQCYVESMRKNLTPMANAFLKLIRETNPGNKANDQLFHQSGKSKGELKTNNATLRERVLEQLEAYGMSASKINLKTLTTEEGLAQLKIQAPLIYEAFNSFYGQSKPKMPKAATPFRFGELAAMLTDNNGKINARLVRKINHTGGFRLQSYSDFQIKNFVDVLQVIFEAGTLGLNGHAYTKVPAFLDATENTNLKRNISIFMYNDGGEWKLDRNDSFPYALDEIYDIVNNDKSGNTSIIAVSQNAEMSAWIMANNNVGYGIPFHKSGLKMGVVRDTIVNDNGRAVKGYSKTKDHTKQQTEVWAKTNGDNKALTKVKKGIDIYEFWDFENKANLSKNKLIEKNLKAYIDACDAAGYLPKFREYVMNNSKVLSDVLRFAKELGFASADATVDDISFKYKGYQIPYGYYKFLGDFGMFTPDGKAAPQKILSLKDYNFDEAVKFFEDGEVLRRNEILQQFSNGEEREKYRNSNLSTEELEKVIKSKRTEVVDEIVGGRKYSTRDNRLTDSEYAAFYQKLDEKKRGVKFPKDREGNFIFTIGNKLVYNNGKYMSPKIGKIVTVNVEEDNEFENTYTSFVQEEIIKYETDREYEGIGFEEQSRFIKHFIEKDFGKEVVIVSDYGHDNGRNAGNGLGNKVQVHRNVEIHFDNDGDRRGSDSKSGGSESGAVRFSDRDSEGNGLTKEQIEYFKYSKLRDENGNLKVMYHGTSNASFTVFNPQYSDDGISLFFTDKKSVAKGYSGTMDEYVPGKKYTVKELTDIINDSYLYVTEEDGKYHIVRNKYGDLVKEYTADTLEEMQSYVLEEYGSTGAGNYKVYLNLTNPLIVDAKGQYWDELEGIGDAEGTTRGYAEYAKKHGYDGVIIRDVVDTAIYAAGNERFESSTVAIAFSPEQVKSVANTTPTADSDIRYSERQTESIYDAVGELKRIQRENDKLKADIERLRKKNRLERTVTGGRELNESQIAAVAGHVLKMAGSRYNKTDFVSELKGIYEYLQGENVEWDVFMSKATDAAQRIIAEARERKVKDDYAMTILSAIRNTRVSFNDTQKAEAEYAYGKNWNRSFFGRVTVANDGIPLESAWSEWASMYPDVFDSDISDADMVTALLDIYDSTRTASEVVETYDKSEAAREIAFEIYNQFWNVSPVRTLADKHDKEVKRLKFEHRQEMKELRERKNAEVFETQWHYSKLIHDVRKARDEKIAQLKKESREYTKQYREKVERRNQISQITKKSLKLNTWLKNNSKDEHIVEELKAPVAAVLRALDFSSERFLGTGVPTQKDISLKKAFAHLHDSLDEIYKRQGEENYTIDMPVDYVEFVKGIKDQVDGIVEKVGDNEYILRDMTLEQLQDVNKMLSVLTHIVTSANKALADANGKAISTMAQSTMLYADGLGDKSSKVGAISNFFNFDNGLPVYVFKMMGEGGYQIFRNMQNGWDKMAFHVKQIIDYSKESYDAKEVKEWGKEVHEFSFDDGSNVKMTTAQIMSLYCLQKRDQARMHLLKGGMRVADFKIGADTISNEAGALLLPHEIDQVVSVLTKRQKEVADSLQKFMNTVCSDWGNEVSMRRFGIKSFGEENYFPIQSDSSVLTGDDTPKTDRGSDVFRLLNMDFTKALNPHANNRIVVDDIFDVFATHTSDMAKYNALALPVLDMFRWYNYKESYRINPDNPEDTRMAAKSLKQSLKKAYGDGSTRYIMQFMKDLNGAHSGGMSNLEKVGRKLISNYKVAAVGANLRVAILQPTSYVRASAVIDAKYLTAALAHKPQIQKAKDTCGIALWKSLGFYDTNISKGVTSLIKHDENAFDWMRDKAMKLAEWGDAMTWGYLYNACEAEIKDTQPNLTGAAKDKAVADRLREVIYATQVVDSTMTRTQNMRDSSMMNQIMTSFMSEPSLSYNMLHDLYIQYNADKRQYGKGAAFKKNGKKIARVSASYLITMCCASVAGGLVDTLRDDDDEEEFGEALISNAAENALSDVLGMLPLVKDIVSIYKGFNVGRMDMQGIQSSYYAYRKLYKMVTEKDFDYKTVYSAAKSVAQTFSQLGGLPVSNLWREFTTIWNNTIGEVYESLKIK